MTRPIVGKHADLRPTSDEAGDLEERQRQKKNRRHETHRALIRHC